MYKCVSIFKALEMLLFCDENVEKIIKKNPLKSLEGGCIKMRGCQLDLFFL